ncbi:MAG: hypothetical protein IJ525_03110 [Alphaproteobacteria bacterium]|nr:hypothetical protein [Alphaproteobacteria bacterium]
MEKTKEEIILEMCADKLINDKVAQEMLLDESLSANDTLYRKQTLMLIQQSMKDVEEGKCMDIDEFFNSF